MKRILLLNSLIAVIFLAFAFSSSAEDYYGGHGTISPQQQYAIDSAIRNDKVDRYNAQQLRATPRYETHDEANKRRSDDRFDYFESIR